MPVIVPLEPGESTVNAVIEQASAADAADIAAMVGELLNEIMTVIGEPAFNFDAGQTAARARDFIDSAKYTVFLARADGGGRVAGFIALYESYALYAEGAFGTIPELYVRPEFRSAGIGKRLVDAAAEHARRREWTRLEVTTPPLPQFERTLRFYERQGFSVSGGRKLKLAV